MKPAIGILIVLAVVLGIATSSVDYLPRRLRRCPELPEGAGFAISYEGYKTVDLIAVVDYDPSYVSINDGPSCFTMLSSWDYWVWRDGDWVRKGGLIIVTPEAIFDSTGRLVYRRQQ